MSNNCAVFTPMCNKILRFYFSDPNRETFQSDLARRQFEAARDALEKASRRDVALLCSIIPFIDGNRDITDSYISRRMRYLEMTREQQSNFYDLLRCVNYRIALSMGYIEKGKTKKEPDALTIDFYDPSTGRREKIQ